VEIGFWETAEGGGNKIDSAVRDHSTREHLPHQEWTLSQEGLHIDGTEDDIQLMTKSFRFVRGSRREHSKSWDLAPKSELRHFWPPSITGGLRCQKSLSEILRGLIKDKVMCLETVPATDQKFCKGSPKTIRQGTLVPLPAQLRELI